MNIILPICLAIVTGIAISLMSIMAKLDFMREDIAEMKKMMKGEEE